MTRAENTGLRIIGVLFILLGITLLASNRVTYTTRERVGNTQSTEIIVKRQKTVVVPRVVSGLIIAGGVITLVVARKNSR